MTARDSIAGLGSREGRGIELFRFGAFERISKDLFLVENPRTRGVYEVDLEGTCTCEDFRRHAHLEGFACKHLHATRLYARWLKRAARVIAPAFGEVA